MVGQANRVPGLPQRGGNALAMRAITDLGDPLDLGSLGRELREYTLVCYFDKFGLSVAHHLRDLG